MSAVKWVLAFQSRHNNSEPEDEWFVKRLSAMPDERVASRLHGAFAVQSVPAERPMGYHVPSGGAYDMWRDPVMRRKSLDYCPELSLIMDMKLEREVSRRRRPRRTEAGRGVFWHDGNDGPAAAAARGLTMVVFGGGVRRAEIYDAGWNRRSNMDGGCSVEAKRKEALGRRLCSTASIVREHTDCLPSREGLVVRLERLKDVRLSGPSGAHTIQPTAHSPQT